MIVLLIPLSIAILFYAYTQYFRKNWWRGLSCALEFDTVQLDEGEEVDVVQVLTNLKRLPLLFLQVKFTTSRGLFAKDYPNATVSDKLYVSDVFSLRSFERVTRRIRFECRKRGFYTIDSADLISTDLFAGNKDYMETEQSTHLYVCPGTLPSLLVAHPMERILGELQRRSFVYEDPFTFRGVRDYMPFDPIKNINQKMTARSGDLKVNLRDSAVSKQVALVLNLDDPQSLFDPQLLEQGIRLVMTLAQEFYREGIMVSVHTNGVDCLTGDTFSASEGESRENLRMLARGLARIDLTLPAPPFSQLLDELAMSCDKGSRTVCRAYCIISTSLRSETVESAQHLSTTAGGLVWLCPQKSHMHSSLNIPGIDFYPVVAD